MSGFKWTASATLAALALAEGQTQMAAAEEADVTDRTIRRWLQEPAFSEEVDRLTLMLGIASRAERIRLAKRAIRQMAHDDGTVTTSKDLLEWLKYAQGETDGLKLDLAALAEAAASLANS